MGYQQAIENAWKMISILPHDGDTISVKLLSDTYTVDLKNKTILSDSCNVPAKEHVSIILLHYLASTAKPKAPAPLTGDWIDFNAIPGGEGYYAAFKKRTIDRVIKKYGSNPAGLTDVVKRLPGEVIDKSDAGVIIRPFKEMEILITISKADEEFGPDANILFDRNITDIFCMEDIVVLSEIVVHSL
jgi:hypothetical protein